MGFLIPGAAGLAVVSGKTLTVSNSLTLAGTDSTTMTFPTTSATIARTDAANTFTGHQTIEGVTSTGATGSGNFVFSASPTFTGQVIVPDGAVGTPSIGLSGNPTTGIFNTGGQFSISIVGTERFRAGAGGLLLSTNATTAISVGATVGSTDLFLSRAGAANFQLGAAAANPPVAQTLSVQNATGTDIAGAARTEIGSLGTGQGVPGRYHIQTGANIAASGTTAQTAIDAVVIGASKVLTNNTVTTIANVTLASGSAAAVKIEYGVEVTNGTDYQIEEGSVVCHVTNKAGTIANNTCVKYGNQQAATSGTLTVTVTITAASPALLQINANSSLTPSTGFPRLRYVLTNLSNQAIAIQ